MKYNQTITDRLCPVCANTLPTQASSKRIYCTERCSKNARMRKARNKPIANPAATPEEVAALLATIAQLQHRNQKYERLITRLRTLLRKHRAQSARAQSAIARAQDKQRRTELDVTQSVEARISRLIAEKRELQEQLLARRDYEEIKQTLDKTNRFAIEQSMQFKQMMDQMQDRLLRLQHVERLEGAVLNDYLYFARYYYRKKPRELWDFLDRSRLQRVRKIQERRKLG